MADYTLVERIDTALLERLARRFADADPTFDRAALLAAEEDWPDTLTPRLEHVTDHLQRALPDDWRPVVARVIADLPADQQTELGFDVWPVIQLLGRGLDDPAASLALLRDLGAKTYAEIGVRAYLIADLHGTLDVLLTWTADPRPGVRRLASESSRPRLPWAPVLRPLLDDPTPTLPILTALRDDADQLTRNSVANHLNDISRTHPDLVVELLAGWLEQPTEAREWIAERALRTLTKGGHAAALALLGRGPVDVDATLTSAHPAVPIGSEMRLTATVVSREPRPREVRVELAVDYLRASGGTSRKVFSWWAGTLAPAEPWKGNKAQHVRDLSTRTHQPGPHPLELLVNGVAVATTTVELTAPGGP